MRGRAVLAAFGVVAGSVLVGCAGPDRRGEEPQVEAAASEPAAKVEDAQTVEVFALPEGKPSEPPGEQGFTVVAPHAEGLTIVLDDKTAPKPGDESASRPAAEDEKVFHVTSAEKDPSHPFYGHGSHYAFVVNGVQGKELVLTRGETYVFDVKSGVQHDFYFTTSPVGWGAGTVTEGVSGQFTYRGRVTFTPGPETPDLVYYQCRNHKNMGGKIRVVNPGETVEMGEQPLAVVPPQKRPPEPEPDRDQVEQKLRFAELMVNSSPLAQRAGASGDEQALALLARATNTLGMARNALAAGDARTAQEHVGEVFATMDELRRALPEASTDAVERDRYEALQEEIETFIGSYERQSVRLAKKLEGAAVLDRSRFEGLLSEAEVLADQSRFAIANERLTEARDMVTAALTALLQAETVVYELNFATAEEEYEYELARYQSYEDLVPVAIEQKQPSANAIELINSFVAKARDIKSKAEEYAAAGDHATGVRALQDATLHIQRALRIAGVQ